MWQYSNGNSFSKGDAVHNGASANLGGETLIIEPWYFRLMLQIQPNAVI
jgi:hypothetical protein